MRRRSCSSRCLSRNGNALSSLKTAISSDSAMRRLKTSRISRSIASISSRRACRSRLSAFTPSSIEAGEYIPRGMGTFRSGRSPSPARVVVGVSSCHSDAAQDGRETGGASNGASLCATSPGAVLGARRGAAADRVHQRHLEHRGVRDHRLSAAARDRDPDRDHRRFRQLHRRGGGGAPRLDGSRSAAARPERHGRALPVARRAGGAAARARRRARARDRSSARTTT